MSELVDYSKMKSIFFFNDWYLTRLENLEFRQTVPEFVEEATFIDQMLDVAWGYPSVFFDEKIGKWKMLYQGRPTKPCFVTAIAESLDGIHWDTPDLTEKVELPGRIVPHQVIDNHGGEISIPYIDKYEDNPEKLIKILFTKPAADGRMIVSSNGINFSEYKIPWYTGLGPEPDPPNAIFYNHIDQCYAITARPMRSDRRISLIETKNWEQFTKPVLIMEPDVFDTPLAQVYGMPVFELADQFIALLWIFHTDPESSDYKYHGGRVDCQLSFSRNGRYFQRFKRETFLGNYEAGTFGSGCIYPSSIVEDEEGFIRIYSSATKGEHATLIGFPERRQSAIIMHRVRKDRFCFLRTGGGVGRFMTRHLLKKGSGLFINIKSPNGEVRFQLVDENGPIEGSDLNSAFHLQEIQ